MSSRPVRSPTCASRGYRCPPKFRWLMSPDFGAVENRPPLLELVDAVRSLFCVQLGHAPNIEHLAAPHGVPEVHLPVVPRVDVAERRRHTTLGHDRVGLAEQALRQHPRRQLVRAALNCRSQASPTGADNDNVVLYGLNL